MLGHCRNHHCLSVEFAKPFYATKPKGAWVILKSKLSQYFSMFKKNLPQNLLITRGSIKSWWSPFCLHVAAASLTYSCKSVWKTLEKEQRKYSIFWESWVELILFRTTSCLNIPFVSAFFLFFFFFHVHVSFFQLADNYHIILVYYPTKN